MSEYQHAGLTDGHWAELPLAQQMGNIGSEVSRALRWKSRDKPERMTPCVERALELIDLSIQWAQREESRKKNPGARSCSS